MAGLLTYWHTLRHLKPVQLYGRLWFKYYKPRLSLSAEPVLRKADGVWCSPAKRRQSLFQSFRFRFLNEEHQLAEIGWDNLQIEKLWRYNLHYFDDLNAENSELRTEWHKEYLTRWIAKNPPVAGTAWEPYPVSLRIVNWIKWALSGNQLSPEFLHSMALQARWLAGRMEYHLLGNHLFANAKALIFAGLFTAGEEAEGWLKKGLKVLEKEIPEQILADGGQFERSTMYHALALEDMLDLYNIAITYCSAFSGRESALLPVWLEHIAKMRHWLVAMTHPDGEISFFNDAAIGIAPSSPELEKYAARLGLPLLYDDPDGITHLEKSGYIRVQSHNMVALLDVAPVGPDYLPGHAHADTLSFELSLFEQRVFVNSGTSCYGNNLERMRQRGTAAHNTVTLNGYDSSEVWSGFRVARRAFPLDLVIEEHSGRYSISCAHDGYRWFRGKPVHIRKWSFTEEKLVVEDSIVGDFRQATARFFLHPAIIISSKISDTGGLTILELLITTGMTIRISFHAGAVRVENSTWHPEFGKIESNVCLLAEFNSSKLKTVIEWVNPP